MDDEELEIAEQELETEHRNIKIPDDDKNSQ